MYLPSQFEETRLDVLHDLVRMLLLILGTALMYGFAAHVCWATESPDARAWTGELVGRISRDEQTQLRTRLRPFFRNSEGTAVVSDALLPRVDRNGPLPRIGPLLFDRFTAVVGFDMWKYKLPNGRLIWDKYNPPSGVAAVLVPEASGNATIAATALLTHLCPKNGVVETFQLPGGGTFPMNSPCELDYSLVIFYPHATTADPDLSTDLTKWAQAWISTAHSPPVQPARKPVLKIFVRILDDGPIDLSSTDAVVSTDIQGAAP